VSPIYIYRCVSCETDYELLMPPGPPDELPAEAPCDNGGACKLKRRWVAPGIGFTDGAGSSPSRSPQP
jgi:predicted nucleic acid-binding Zn ribbon protein